MKTFISILVCLLSAACGGATWNEQNTSDAINEARCEAQGIAGPDGGHMRVYHACLRDAGLLE